MLAKMIFRFLKMIWGKKITIQVCLLLQCFLALRWASYAIASIKYSIFPIALGQTSHSLLMDNLLHLNIFIRWEINYILLYWDICVLAMVATFLLLMSNISFNVLPGQRYKGHLFAMLFLWRRQHPDAFHLADAACNLVGLSPDTFKGEFGC